LARTIPSDYLPVLDHRDNQRIGVHITRPLDGGQSPVISAEGNEFTIRNIVTDPKTDGAHGGNYDLLN
jgi:hypothetical protein